MKRPTAEQLRLAAMWLANAGVEEERIACALVGQWLRKTADKIDENKQYPWRKK